MRTLPESCEFGLAPRMIISMPEFSVGRTVSNEESFSDFQREKSPEQAAQLRASYIVYCGANHMHSPDGYCYVHHALEHSAMLGQLFPQAEFLIDFDHNQNHDFQKFHIVLHLYILVQRTGIMDILISHIQAIAEL